MIKDVRVKKKLINYIINILIYNKNVDLIFIEAK